MFTISDTATVVRPRRSCAQCIVIVSALWAVPVLAVDTNFNGSGDGTNWTDAANWSNGQPINTTFNAFIKDGGAFNVSLNVARTINDLTIGNDDSLNILNNVFLTLNGDLFNDGTINVNAVGNNTGLTINTGILSGIGKIVLNGANAQLAGSGTVTQQAGHTIAGFGSIGQNAFVLVNNGLIDANSAGNVLLVDVANSAANTNAGTMQASNGGILQLTGFGSGGINNTGGTLRATGTGSEVQFLSGFGLSGGTLTTAAGGVIRTLSGHSASLSNLTNEGSYIGSNNSTTNLGGTITNNGTMKIDAGVNNTDFSVSGGLTLNGSGSVVMSGVNARLLGSGTLTNEAGHTIKGMGSLGNNVIQIVNHGLIDANVTGGALSVDPVNAVGGVTNNATMQASNGGIMVLTGFGSGSFDNTNGTIQAIGGGSEVQLVNSVAISGGDLTSASGGVIRTLGGHTANLSNLSHSGTFIGDNNSTTNLNGTITNNGTMTIAANANNTFLNSNGDMLLTGAGKVIFDSLDPTASRAIMQGGGTLTHDVNHTIEGQGNVGNNSLAIINKGLINANVSDKTLVVDPSNSVTGVTNTGTLRASNGGKLQLTGFGVGGFHNDGGKIEAIGAGSEIQLLNSASLDGGLLTSSGGGVIRNLANHTANFANLTHSGTFIGENNSTTNLNGTITNNGTMTITANANNTFLNSNGDMLLTGAGKVIFDSLDPTASRAIMQGGGTLTHDVNHTIEGQGNVGNNSLALINKGLINANVPGKTLVVDPSNSATAVTNTGTLRASNGGKLQLTGFGVGGFHNDGGKIEAVGAGSEIQLLSSASLDGGLLTSTGGGVIRNLASHTASLADLTHAGTFIGENNSTTNITGVITNNGTMTIDAGANVTSMNVTGGAATLTGTGKVIMSGANARITGGGTLTHEAGHTIEGQGNLGNNQIAILNKGLINANVIGAGLTVDPGNVATGVTNTATMRASDGGRLVLTGFGSGGFHNDGGVIEAIGAGSEVQLLNSASLDGGLLTSTGGGVIRNLASHTASLADLTHAGTFIGENNSTTNITGVITNNGTMTIDAGANVTSMNVTGGAATLAGTGKVIMSGANARITGGGTLTHEAGHTIEGQGNLGNNQIAIINNGLVDANVNAAGLTIDPSSGGNVLNNGTLQASNGGTMNLTGFGSGSFTNPGTIQALNGSTVQTVVGGVITNSNAGTLTGGTYRSVSTGAASSVALNGPGISTIAPNTTVELSGAAAAMTFGGTALQSSLVTNNGSLKIHDGHTFTMTNALTNNGSVSLGGVGLADATLNSGGNITNGATGEIFGHGTIQNTILNHGTVRAANGTLTMNGKIDGQSGIIQIDSGASLDLSSAGGDSDTDLLTHNGVNLNLGANNLLVRVDYTNASFGTGNSFNGRAHVTGSGLIQASPAISQTLTGDVAGGADATPSIDFGNIRVGQNVSKNYAVNNVGATGPVLRGAIQNDNTAGNGGNITDARLSGSGVTAQNFGPIANNSATSSLGVTFTGTSAGALTGQKVAVVNNFDNVANQLVTLTGTAYNPAVADVTPATINLGNFHVGDTIPGQAINIHNAAPAGAFTEDLRAENITANPAAALVGGSPTAVNVIGGATNSAVSVTMSAASVGAKTGTVTMDLKSNATVDGAAIPGLSPLSLGSASVNVNATVYRLAAPAVTSPLNLGEFHVGDTAQGNVVVSNSAANDSYSESLSAQVSGFAPDVIAASGSAAIVPQGNSGSNLIAQLSTASAGAKSGTVTIKLDSLAGASGLANTNLGSQNATVTANVYNLAAPVVNNAQPVSFGIVHVGDTVTQNLSITNAAAAGAFSEKLNASFGTPGDGATTNSGLISLLTPQGNDNTSMVVGLNTATSRTISTTVPLSFKSDGTGVNSLGITDLGSQNVSITGQVNSFANPLFSKNSGDGILTKNTALDYSLDFDTVLQNSGSLSAGLSLLNDVLAPADELTGSYALAAADFTMGGFGNFSGLVAGDSILNLTIGLSTANVGSFTGLITLSPRSQNISSFDGVLPNVVIHLSGTISPVPEPSCLALCLLSAALIRRRRQAVGR